MVRNVRVIIAVMAKCLEIEGTTKQRSKHPGYMKFSCVPLKDLKKGGEEFQKSGEVFTHDCIEPRIYANPVLEH